MDRDLGGSSVVVLFDVFDGSWDWDGGRGRSLWK